MKRLALIAALVAVPVAASALDLAEVQHNDECRLHVHLWDTGQRERLVDTYGRFTEDVVENCRYMLKIKNIPTISEEREDG